MENWTIFITELFVPMWLQTATAVASARLWNFFHLRVTDHTHNWYISFIMFDICELGINSRPNRCSWMDGWISDGSFYLVFLQSFFGVTQEQPQLTFSLGWGGTGVLFDWHQHQSEGPDVGDIIHVRNELTANCGVELGGFHGSNWFISSPLQLPYYLNSFGLPVDTKSVSPSSVLHLFSPCLLPLCLFLSKKVNICIFPKLLVLFFIPSWSSSLLSTHPVCKAPTHMPLLLSWFQSHFLQLSQGISTCMLSPCWQQGKNHVMNVLCLLTLFIFYFWNGDKFLQIWNTGMDFLAFSLLFVHLFWQPRQEQGSVQGLEPAAG